MNTLWKNLRILDKFGVSKNHGKSGLLIMLIANQRIEVSH